VLVLAVLMVSYASSLKAYLQQRQHLTTLRAEIADSTTSIAQLEREKKRWKDPAYVRAITHERLGWVLPGEIGFQVIGPDGKPLDHHDTLSAPAATKPVPAPWWQSAWGSVEAAGNPPKAKDDVPPPVARISAPKSGKH
jgi:hypothetical protein